MVMEPCPVELLCSSSWDQQFCVIRALSNSQWLKSLAIQFCICQSVIDTPMTIVLLTALAVGLLVFYKMPRFLFLNHLEVGS